MTSGKFLSIPVSSVIVSRPERQRRELTSLEELAKSIAEVGLINPIVIDQNNVLIAGERRFTAIRDHLGWTHVTAQRAEDLPPEVLYLIELEENVKRVDLPWQDQCRAVDEYHNLKRKSDQSWNVAKTASALGVSASEVYSRVAVHKAIESGDKLVLGADKYSTARGIVERQKLRAKESASEQIAQMLTPQRERLQPNESDEESFDDEPANLEVDFSSQAPWTPYLHADFAEWQRNYSGPKFNFLHCDFPYGVNAGKHNQGAAGAFGGYEDSKEVFWSLVGVLANAMENVVAESAHMMFWFSMDYYSDTLTFLREMGWNVNPFPLIWHKSDNSGILPDPKRGPRRIYETAFLCSRGDRLIAQAVGNTFAAPNLKTIHMSEKNPDMLAHFFRMFVDSSTVMLDPTMGSGNAVKVAERMGASYVLGLERDQIFFSTACEAYLKNEGLTSREE